MSAALDPVLVAAEIAARQVYWRVPRLASLYNRRRERGAVARRVDRARLRDRLSSIGVVAGANVLVHSSIAHLALDAPGAEPAASPLVVASQLLADLLGLVGSGGTLAMPTHPLYRDDPGFMHDKAALELVYEPAKTPSRVGFLTELFRRRPGVLRSRHPLSSLACRGPMAEAWLRDNLDGEAPLPHGHGSAYHRFCESDGLVISIGTPLIKAITVLHVAEELRDREWPVRGFFYERRFVLRESGGDRTIVVRERRPQFVRSLALGQVRRDLLRAGILRESELQGVRIDCASAGAVLAYMSGRQASSSYPYLWPSLAGA